MEDGGWKMVNWLVEDTVLKKKEMCDGMGKVIKPLIEPHPN